MNPHLERLQKARINLLLDDPFFGALLLHLKPILDRSGATKTFRTDGRSLWVNPEFQDQLNDAELRTVLTHEVMHCALLHPFRRGERDLKRFNIAADYAINNFLEAVNAEAQHKHHTAPFSFTGPLADTYRGAYQGLSAEEIYSRLTPPENESPSESTADLQSAGNAGTADNMSAAPSPSAADLPSHAADAPSSPGEFMDGAPDEATRQEREAEWKVAIQQAALTAKNRGQLPGAAARFIDELLHPKVPWTEVLRQFLTAAAKDDYSWTRPNRRYSQSRVILPGLHSPRLGKVVVAVDTSGSIGQEEFSAFMAEVQSILFNCRPETFVLAQCDAALHQWEELDLFADVTRIEVRGGGGTDFCPVFERADREAEPPAALIYLTDMLGRFPEQPPAYPVLWARTTTVDAPWGLTVDLK